MTQCKANLDYFAFVDLLAFDLLVLLELAFFDSLSLAFSNFALMFGSNRRIA